MHLTLDPGTGRYDLHDAADLTSLTVVVPSARNLPLVADAIPVDLGTATQDGRHVLLRCDALHRLAGVLADDPSWQAGFEAMLTYAERQGWTTPDRSAVRAHCVAAATRRQSSSPG